MMNVNQKFEREYVRLSSTTQRPLMLWQLVSYAALDVCSDLTRYSMFSPLHRIHPVHYTPHLILPLSCVHWLRRSCLNSGGKHDGGLKWRASMRYFIYCVVTSYTVFRRHVFHVGLQRTSLHDILGDRLRDSGTLRECDRRSFNLATMVERLDSAQPVYELPPTKEIPDGQEDKPAPGLALVCAAAPVCTSQVLMSRRRLCRGRSNSLHWSSGLPRSPINTTQRLS
jgi:hypothetical protein